MKKLLIMGSDSAHNLESIVKWFQSKDIQINCISDVEDSLILKKAQELNLVHEFVPAEQNLEYFKQNKFDLVAMTGYMSILPEDVLALSKFISIHQSLLPAFKGKDAIKQAFLAGVKVSGITIHYVTKECDSGKIIAQYPIFIANDMHFDEFEYEINTIEKKLYPIVIEKVLNDQVFDFQDLMKSSCNNKGCGGSSSDNEAGGCKGCH